MSVRTKRECLTFTKPFTLRGIEGTQNAGTYMVQTDEEPIEGLSFIAYRRIATVIFLPLRHGGAGSLQAVSVEPWELADALPNRGADPAVVE